jgi:pyrroloquinoline quinone (PQQ) biosynthesis protein C
VTAATGLREAYAVGASWLPETSDEPGLPRDEFIRELKQEIVNHPYYFTRLTLVQKFVAGELTREQLQQVALQFYFIQRDGGSTYSSALQARVPFSEKDARRVLLMNSIEEEFGPPEGHPILAKKFAMCFGLSEEEVEARYPVASAVAWLTWVKWNFNHAPLPEAIISWAAPIEFQTQNFMGQFAEALRTKYGVTDEEALQVWDVHAKVDSGPEGHADVFIDLVARYARTRASQRRVKYVADVALEIFGRFMEDLLNPRVIHYT